MISGMENKKWLDEYASLKQVNPNNPFTVPNGYFDGLGQQITSIINLNELTGNIPLDGFTVPENYFEELGNNIQSRIAVENILGVENTGFTVPENYFEELDSNIQSRIFVENILKTESNRCTQRSQESNSVKR